MRIIPAVSIKEGQVVEAKDDSYYPVTDEAGEPVDLQDLLLEIKKKYGIVCMLDIDGIKKNEPSLQLIQRSSLITPVWMYAGSRDIMGIMDVLVTGVFKVIIGTRTLQGMELLEEAYEMSDNVMVSFDHDSELLCPSRNLKDMGLREMARKCKETGIGSALFFDLGRNSKGGELNRYDIGKVQEVFGEVYVAGILSPTEIDTLAEMGVTGVIVDIGSLTEWGIEGDPDDWDIEVIPDHDPYDYENGGE